MDVEFIINELQHLKKMQSKKELAAYLGFTVQALNDWKKRGSVNVKRILNKFPEINPQWLMTGEGNMLITPLDNGGNAFGEGAMNHSNSNIIIEKFLNEISEQRKVTQSVVEQNTILLKMLSDGSQQGS